LAAGSSLVIGNNAVQGAVFSLSPIDSSQFVSPTTAVTSPVPQSTVASSDLNPVPEPTTISMTLVAVITGFVLWWRKRN